MPAPKNGIKKHNGGGASKAKGQIRAKSGCYTCRIRRKKCDEARNDEGRCANCERLKVQCLGFGPKRPDWLKDKQSDWIKRIKAHCAGSGKNRASTSSPQATDYLVLLPLDESDGDMSPRDSPASHTSFELPEYPDFSATTPQMIDPLYTFDDTSALSAGMSTFDATSYDPLSTLSTVATISHLAPSYNANYLASDYDFPLEDELYPYGAIQPMLMPGDAIVNHYVHHYVNEVAGKQFLLIDRATLAFLSETINNSSGGLAFSAVRLLSNIHAQRQVHGDVSCFAGPAIMNQYELTKQLLSHRRQTHVYTADEAWGALFVTSSFLFDGGRGEWDLWIHVACQYARRFVKDDPRGALARSNPPERLLIKSAIWFDVLAAVTTRRRPEMMREIRQLFHPQVSRIQDIEEEDDVTSMMSPMGCESRVVWALAETLDLAVWKEEKLKLGQLSVPELYNRAREIETYLSQPPAQCASQDQTALKRYFCSEMFRTSTILFLRSVVSGSHPAVYEIRSAVKNVFGVLNKMRRDFPEIVPSVVRMTVFSFFLCGSLTDEDSSRRDIFTILNGEGNVGNCSSLGRLLQHQIWSNRPLMSTSPDPVLWREALQAEKMLLV